MSESPPQRNRDKKTGAQPNAARHSSPPAASVPPPRRSSPSPASEQDDQELRPPSDHEGLKGKLTPSAKIYISNLPTSLTRHDVLALFSTIALPKYYSINYDRFGKSMETAKIIYNSYSHAIKAAKTFNMLYLDGKDIMVQVGLDIEKLPELEEPKAHHRVRLCDFTLGRATEVPYEHKSAPKKKKKRWSHIPSDTLPRTARDDVFQQLGDNGKCLFNWWTSYPKDGITFNLDRVVFHYDNKCRTFIYVSVTDVQHLMEWGWISSSHLQLFMLYLHPMCNYFQIGYACPLMIAKTSVTHYQYTKEYLIRLIKHNKNKKFVFAPYHEENYWLLLVICIRSKSVYVFDSSASKRTLEIKACLNEAFREASLIGPVENVLWKSCKYPQQMGSHECGYYVMRAMFDIVSKYSSFDSLDAVFRGSTFSINNLNEIRELWAVYFLDKCLNVS